MISNKRNRHNNKIKQNLDEVYSTNVLRPSLASGSVEKDPTGTAYCLQQFRHRESRDI